MTGAGRARRARLLDEATVPRCRAVLAALAVLCVPAVANATAGGTVQRGVAAEQRLAALSAPHAIFAAPDRSAARLGRVEATRPLTGERTVLPVVGRATGARGLRWLHVRLPGRPNGHAGWIAQTGTVASSTAWHLVVELAQRRLAVYYDGRLLRVFAAVVGKPSTPTPRGSFFVEEDVQLAAGDAGGPFALALSARSEVLQAFDGGPGQIAIHGLDSVGGVLGTAASHGCVRVADDATRWLVRRIGPGVPVTVTG
jgi:lipoprotein-anchoring transpeptidase ErfK/SrfK